MIKEKLPQFITDRLLLRGVTEADSLSYTKYFVDYNVISQLTANVPWPYPENGVLEYIQNEILPKQGIDQWTWGIFEKNMSKELIGAVELWREGTPENRGFWLGKAFWGKGYMTEAVRPITDYAFNQLGFKKLIFANAVGNKRSARVKEKMGARLLYKEPKKFVNPDYTEHEVWELTKKEWETFSKY